MIVITDDSAPDAECGPSWRLSPGDIFPFGSSDQAGLKIPGEQVPDIIGLVRVSKYYWSVENTSPEATIVAENTQGCDFVTIQRGMRLPIPFTSSRVIVFCGGTIFSFSVRTPSDSLQDATVPVPKGVGHAAQLDRGAKYFRVLIALCEPAIRNGFIADVPSSTDIARRLHRISACRTITRASVDFHLNYLYRHKLGALIDNYFSILGASVPPVGRYRRIMLVQFALRFRLVTPHHLRLLDELPGAGAGHGHRAG